MTPDEEYAQKVGLYKHRVETEYREKRESVYTKTGHKGMIEKKTVLKFLYEHRQDEKIWWWSWEFIGQRTKEGRILSHRSCARASDLAIQDPMLVEDRKAGRFKMYRLRRENINLVKARLGIRS